MDKHLKQLPSFFTFFLGGLVFAPSAHALSDKTDLLSKAKQEISKNFAGARVEVIGPIRWTNGTKPEHVKLVQFLGDDGRGNAHIFAQGVGPGLSLCNGLRRAGFIFQQGCRRESRFEGYVLANPF